VPSGITTPSNRISADFLFLLIANSITSQNVKRNITVTSASAYNFRVVDF
jgi:hypothetical protein